jgi:hypothetical protein
MPKMPAAFNPEAMERLNRFARDFETYEKLPGAAERLLSRGYWLAKSRDAYSVAAVPVVWPEVSETGRATEPAADPVTQPNNSSPTGDSGRAAKSQKNPVKLPDKLNTTGAGDMTFGAFFLLGGV